MGLDSPFCQEYFKEKNLKIKQKIVLKLKLHNFCEIRRNVVKFRFE